MGNVLGTKTRRKYSEAKSKRGNPGNERDSSGSAGAQEDRKRGKTQNHPKSGLACQARVGLRRLGGFISWCYPKLGVTHAAADLGMILS